MTLYRLPEAFFFVSKLCTELSGTLVVKKIQDGYGQSQIKTNAVTTAKINPSIVVLIVVLHLR